ncbi:MAG TPA: hypothetical protein VF670_20585 [Duganella sp.]|jgi:hypothetical protein
MKISSLVVEDLIVADAALWRLIELARHLIQIAVRTAPRPQRLRGKAPACIAAWLACVRPAWAVTWFVISRLVFVC